MIAAHPYSRPRPCRIVLVEPEVPENIGFIARSMACFGFRQLAWVGPPLDASSPAFRTGTAAPEILLEGKAHPDLESALSGCALALAFTRRPRLPGQAVLTLDQVLDDLVGEGMESGSGMGTGLQTEAEGLQIPDDQGLGGGAQRPIALVFGRESAGLTRAETLLCDAAVTIPMASKTLSLNLSHAVTLVLQAVFARGVSGRDTGAEGEPEALMAGPNWSEAEKILARWMDALEKQGFFRSGKEAAQREKLRLLFRRLCWNGREVEFLLGALKRLRK